MGARRANRRFTLLAALTAGCAGAGPATPAAPLSATASKTATAAATPIDLRAVDWRNRAYLMFTLRDGHDELREYEELGGRHDITEWAFAEVLYADLTGDGAPEAVVRVEVNSWTPDGRASSGSEVYVFGAAPAEVVRLGHADFWGTPVTALAVEPAATGAAAAALVLTVRYADSVCRERWTLRDGDFRLASDSKPSCERR